MRTVAGRLESRYSYSNTIVYNNFPFLAAERKGDIQTDRICSETDIIRRETDTMRRVPTVGTPRLASVQKHITTIETAAQRILDARQRYRQQAVDYNQKIANGGQQGEPIAVPCLADFYRTGNLFTELAKAHHALDNAVDAAYGYAGNDNDEERVAFWFGLLQKKDEK